MYDTKELAQAAGEKALKRAAGIRHLHVAVTESKPFWYWGLVHPQFTLTRDDSGKFSIYMLSAGQGWNTDVMDEDPVIVVKAALERARDEVTMLQGCIEDIETSLRQHRSKS